jgi:hypothetical protein
VFGMGTGGTLSLLSPETLLRDHLLTVVVQTETFLEQLLTRQLEKLNVQLILWSSRTSY